MTDNPSEISINSSEIDSSIENVPDNILVDLFGGAEVGGIEERDLSERYAYSETIGEGGQGIVFSAEDKLLERTVAIKALKISHDPAHEKLLEQEAKLCGRLEHPNIVPTYDLVRDEADSPLFVMKKIYGQTLDEFLEIIKKDGLLVSNRFRLLSIFTQVLNAIDFAHSKGVLHLDLKPANISLGKYGEVYVIDWGFARAKDDIEVKGLSGGTLHYMSPERMDKKKYDEKADIYSLGVMLYRLLTGRHPRSVKESELKDFKRNYKAIPLIPPRERDRSIPVQLEAIVLKAMAEDPLERYASAHEFATDLDRYLQMLPVSAYDESIFGMLWRWLRKNRRKVYLTIITLILFAVSGYAFYTQQQAEKRRIAAEKQQAEFARSERERKQSMRRRYEARRVLKRADDIFEKNKEAAEASAVKSEKEAILAPVAALYSKSIEMDPDYAEAYEKRASVYRMMHDFNNALKDYDNAFELDSSYIMVLYDAGMIYADILHDTQKARDKFYQMSQLFPDDEYAELGQARVDLIEAGAILKLKPNDKEYDKRFQMASEIYSKTLERCQRIEETNPALSDIWYLRGLIYQKSPEHKNLEKALEAYSQYLLSRRDSASAFLNRGDTYKDLEMYTEAIEDYTESLKLNPDFIWALRNRGYILYRYLNMPEAAIKDLDKAIILEPEAAWSYMSRGAVYIGMKEYAAAKKDYAKAMALAPDDVNIIYNNAVLALYMSDPKEAEELFTRALGVAVEPEYIANLEFKRGLTRFAQEKYPDAISDFESSISKDTEDKIYPALFWLLALKISGMPFDANHFGSNITIPEDKVWLSALASYLLDEAEEIDVLELAGDPFAGILRENDLHYNGSKEHKKVLLATEDLKTFCELRLYLGFYDLANDNIDGARMNFRACLDTAQHLYLEHALAKIFLKKIE